MNPDEILFYKIDDYLRGRLAPGERAAFEAELVVDAPLAALVSRQEQENQALELLTERDLRLHMNAWERQMPTQQAPVARRVRLDWLRWAVAAMLICAAGWWLLQRERPVEAPIVVQPESPVAKPNTVPKPGTSPKPKTTPRPNIAIKPAPSPTHPQRHPTVQPPKDAIATAPTTTPPPPIVAKTPSDYAALADEFYRERDFISSKGGGGAAAKALAVKELFAQSLLKSRNYDAAVTAFQEIANTHQQPYADRADWALALVYLRQMPRRSGALNQLLRNITARPGHAFYAKAKALQARLGEK